MKVLYISYDGMTDPLGQSQVIPYLIGLSQKGHRFTIISCEKKTRYAELKETIQNLLSSNNIDWIPVMYETSPPLISRWMNVRRMRIKAIEFCRTKKPQLVHCRSYMSALIGLTLKQKFGIKFLFDMRGLWADERIDGGIWDLKKFIHRKIYHYFKKKEIEFLSSADYTISLTQNAKNEILGWKEFRKSELPVEVIPCCADLNLFSYHNVNDTDKIILRKKLGIDANDFVLNYLGSVGTWYMLDEMLDFFKVLLRKNPTSKFLIVTPDEKSKILESANEKQIPADKLIIVSAKRNEVVSLLAISDLALYFIKPVYSKKASSPTKTAEIMGMGIPIVTNKGIGDSDLIIQDSEAGWIVTEFSEREYERIIDNFDRNKINPENIRKNAFHYFSLDRGVELYNSVYHQLEK